MTSADINFTKIYLVSKIHYMHIDKSYEKSLAAVCSL